MEEPKGRELTLRIIENDAKEVAFTILGPEFSVVEMIGLLDLVKGVILNAASEVMIHEIDDDTKPGING